ncbi:hypothetical protein ODV21_09740 [Lactobacillus amylovorus]|uniref:hypothetical protein n=1 Tax=Lactobacillus amylovorus TaxID=1604 RepID=UPI00232BFD53|nr:hypothetical protein [Lactobacillus amylovorus]MDB6243849.1 hypothetical protein [Lactobacillus amylovorus]
MSLKMLNRFQVFDSDRFFSGKKFLLLKLTPWVEPGTDKKESRILGTKVVGAIAIDDTVYSKDVKGINEGETITFKVRQPLTSFQNWEPLQTIFVATQFDRVVIWGDFHNQLSVRVPTLKEIQN